MIKKFLKFFLKLSTLFVLFITILFLGSLTVYYFSYQKQPKEYGICIDSIENNSDTDVTFINLLEQTHYTIKPKESMVINSWLAASDWKLYPYFSWWPLFNINNLGSVTETSNRSCLLVTKVGLFVINLGRNHSFLSDSDQNAHIWIAHTNEHGKQNQFAQGYNLVTVANRTQKRKIIINEAIHEPTEFPDRITTNFEFQLSDNPILMYEEKIERNISSVSDFYFYQYILKENNIKFIPCSTAEKSKPSTHQNHDVE